MSGPQGESPTGSALTADQVRAKIAEILAAWPLYRRWEYKGTTLSRR